MDTIVGRCAGLDIHKDSIQAGIRLRDERGQLTVLVESFGTMTADILAMGDRLAELGVTHVAMESTGVYWKPIWNLLEDRFTLLLANARHIKHVPGRKTDVLDCQWIAQLLECGLLRGSMVPPRPLRQARELLRARTQLVADKARLANRLQKHLEDANIKLASVASDVLGKSGRAMLAAMAQGQSDPKQLADMAVGKLQRKHEPLQRALAGRVDEHHRFMLQLLLDQLSGLEQLIKRLEDRIDQIMQPWREQIDRLDQIPGVDRRTGQSIIAETGADMSRFPSAAHLASWAGMCPGNHESAGKRKSGTTRPGNRWLRTTLVQSAWAASHTKRTYLSSQYRRLASRRGRKKALVAVGRSVLTIAYEMLEHGTKYQDLGHDYFDKQQPARQQRQLVARLERLGFTVTLERRSGNE